MFLAIAVRDITNTFTPGNLLVAGALSTSLFSIFCSSVSTTNLDQIDHVRNPFPLFLNSLSKSILSCVCLYCLSLLFILSHHLIAISGVPYYPLMDISFLLFYFSTIILMINFAHIFDFMRGIRDEAGIEVEYGI